jgi:hypothetical protein
MKECTFSPIVPDKNGRIRDKSKVSNKSASKFIQKEQQFIEYKNQWRDYHQE